MADLVPLEGLENLLQLVINNGFPLTARLFTAPAIPDETTTLAGITEATFSGYAPVTLAPLDPPEVSDDAVARSQVVTASFAHNGGPVANVVTGYYVTIEMPGGSQLLWVGQDDEYPLTFASVTDSVDLSLEILETQEV
jgi:hypothetical protein